MTLFDIIVFLIGNELKHAIQSIQINGLIHKNFLSDMNFEVYLGLFIVYHK